MTRPVALVTGGARNIGWACVLRLAATHEVWVADTQAPEAPLPDGVHYLAADVARAADCRAAVAAALGAPAGEGAAGARGLAVWVHSAAITAPARPIEAIPEAEWRQLVDVNLTGAFLMAQAAIPALRRAQGCAVLIASRAGRTGVAALNASASGTKAHYAATKAGLLSLVKSLAIELAPDGVRVNAVVPGSIEGTMIPRERWDALAAQIPLGRLGTPGEVADAVAFLCSPQAAYVTGHALDVNGGTWMS
ncbi:SDR family NAD(P)-dependent oxidoreductase [Piscinibacter sakaiensis]|uniref:3-oxoacyl-ACP reductase n=1 Tax=Piscinibacter sakaiensis TaxID=1547922 RepID=A0A0K8NZG9_PISS1|nr:SDR family oxidoreductase [Piscinibacter sakaiensis]GAP35781.1 3-oxoacyl-ACP reductase [Piscinibacter sakaiensis]